MTLRKVPQTVVETPSFSKQAESCMDKESIKSFIDHIALNPTAGALIQDTGGARKIRWSGDSHSGKRGGVRVIYYYYDQSVPIFLFTVYGKSQKETLTKKDKKDLRGIIELLVKSFEDE